jgi:hypothetical protein
MQSDRAAKESQKAKCKRQNAKVKNLVPNTLVMKTRNYRFVIED